MNPYVVKREPWMDSAVCASVDPELFFPEQGAHATPAKRVCQGWPCGSGGDLVTALTLTTKLIQAVCDAENSTARGVVIYPEDVARVLGVVLPLLAKAIDEQRESDRRERTADSDEDSPCDSPHWQCHAAAAWTGFSEAEHLIRYAARDLVTASTPSVAQAFETGPHDLVVSVGDCEFYGKCACGQSLGTVRPNVSLDVLGERWERHVMAEHRGCDCEPCSW